MSFTVRQRSPRVKNGYLDKQPEISEFSLRTRLEASHVADGWCTTIKLLPFSLKNGYLDEQPEIS